MRKSHVVTCVYFGAGCVGAMNVPLLGFSVVPQCLQRVIDDVCRDAGYEELTTNQVDAITTFLHGKDVFVSLPTGSGKSVCFALLPIVVH